MNKTLFLALSLFCGTLHAENWIPIANDVFYTNPHKVLRDNSNRPTVFDIYLLENFPEEKNVLASISTDPKTGKRTVSDSYYYSSSIGEATVNCNNNTVTAFNGNYVYFNGLNGSGGIVITGNQFGQLTGIARKHESLTVYPGNAMHSLLRKFCG